MVELENILDLRISNLQKGQSLKIELEKVGWKTWVAWKTTWYRGKRCIQPLLMYDWEPPGDDYNNEDA